MNAGHAEIRLTAEGKGSSPPGLASGLGLVLHADLLLLPPLELPPARAPGPAAGPTPSPMADIYLERPGRMHKRLKEGSPMTGTWRREFPRGRTASRSWLEGFAVVTLVFRNVGNDMWTGECRELGTATDGAGLTQVDAELIDLVVLHLNALEQAGERERFFEKHGIRFYSADLAPTVIQFQMPLDEDAFVHPHKVPLARAA